MKNFTASLRTLVGEYIINTCTPNSKQKKKPSVGLKNHARGKFSNFWYFFIVPLIFASYLSDAQVNPLTPIQGFNVFSYGNATVNSGDFNGGLAVSGNLTTKGAFSLAMSSTGTFKASGDANNTVLIVEGNVNYQAGSGINVLSNGFVKIKDFSTSKYWATNPTRLTSSSASSQDANPRINLSTTQTQASINADVFDFNGTIATLRSYSDTYKNCSSNTTVSTSVNSYTFNVTAGRTNFYKISAATLANFNEIKFSIVPSATNPVVITVDLGSLTTYNWNIPNFPGVPNAAGQYILFNFVNGSTTTVNLNGGGTIIGTVFAPYSHVAKLGSGNIEGQIVCLNYNHDQGEVHYQPFGTTLNCSTYSSVTCDCPGGLLLNSGFELQENRAGYDASYKTRNWEWNSEATLTTGSGFEVCDANNAYLYAKSSGAAMWQKVNNITEGTAYTLSAYGGTHEPSYNHRYRLAFYNSAGTLLSFVEAQVDWDVDIVPAGQPKLKEYVLNGVAPIGTSYLRVEGYASGDWLKLDNLCLTVNNTCNNLTSGGTIGANQVLCKNVSSTPAKIANVTLPSGGDTGQGISYQWYRATSLENGACPTNVSGSNKYTAISGATSSEYTPGAITQTTCYIRTAKRANCSGFVAESNAVLVVLKNNCTVTPCANNLVTNASFETDDNGTYGGKKFPVYFQSSPASYITRTSTNTDIYRGASPTNWSIGTNVNDYANQNGAYYIDASVTGNANSGDRFIYGRYNQCVVFSNNSNQVFLPVTPGKKYTICAYMAAFNPSGVQGNADVYFEYKFRNGNDGSQGILSSGEILKVVPADTDGKWETLGWQQYCVEITAPLGASYLEFYITPRDEEGDGVGIDDVCLTETDCTPAPTVSSAAICGTGTSTFTATGCTGGTVKWYSSLSSTTPLATGASYTPTSKSNSFSLFATCTLNSCESIRQAVSLTVNGSVSGVTATASGGNTSACGVPIQINGTGSVANPNLVYNGDFSAGNVGFTTNYGNQNNGYGVYGIVTNANSYFNWASACQDRTAAGTGNIFVADGGVTASLTVWSQRIVVNPNTTYRLSAWASSISSTLPSQLALYINGTKVGTTATLSATTCLWQQLTTTWNSGTNTAITLEIRNENTNSGGNDFALDDISMTVETPSVSYSWSGPGGFTSSSQNISASTTGTYTLTVSGNNGCSSSASIAVTVNPTPSTPIVTPSARCGTGIVALGATCGAGEVVQWYASQTSTVVLATGTSYSPNISTTTTYYVACKNTTSNCETPTGSRQSVIGTVNPIPSSPSSGNVTNGSICGAGVVSLGASCGAGEVVQWYASQTSTVVLATGTSYSPNISTTTTYYVACKNTTSNCETPTGSRQSVIGTVNPIPSSPSSGNVTNGSICGAGVVSLGASCGAGEVVQWYASQTSTVVLATGTSYSPNISTTTTYYVACKNTTSNCETPTGSRQSVIGTVNPIPSSPSSGNVTNGSICGAGVVSLGASCGAGEVVQWYASQTSTAVLATGTSYSPNISTTTTYYVACKNTTSNCETPTGSRQSVIGTVNPIPSSPSSGNVTNGSICGAGVVSLGASCGAGEVVQWYASQTSTVVLATGTSYSPNISTTTTYYVACKNTTSNCETPTGSRQSVIGTVNTIPSSPSSGNVTNGSICGAGVVSLGASCGAGEVVQWYASQTSTVVLATGTSYSPNISTTTTYYVACKNTTSNCETPTGSRQSVIGTVNPIPSSPSSGNVTNGSICGAGVVSLGASCGVGEVVQWYASQTSTAVLATGTSYSPSISTTTTYYVGCKDNSTNCETPTGSRQGVIGTVNPIPSAPVAGNITNGSICGAGVVSLGASCGVGETVQWYASQTSTVVLSAGNSYSPNISTTTTYYVACKNDITNCEVAIGGRTAVIGTVNPIPSSPSSGNVQGGSVCGTGSLTLTANCNDANLTSVWYSSQTSTAVLATGNTYTVAVTANVTYYVACKNIASSCETPAGNRRAVEVIYNDKPAPVAISNSPICVGGTLNLSTSGGTTYSWDGPNGFNSTSATPVITNVALATSGIYTVTVAGAGGCAGTATVEVMVKAKPTVTATVIDGTVCTNSSILLNAAGTPAIGSTIASYDWTGPSTFASTSQNPTIPNAVEANEGFYTVKATDSFGCTATSQVFVWINPLPSATASSEGGNIICQGAPISLYANGAGIGGSYVWTGPAGSGFSSTIQNPTINNASPIHVGVYTVNITDANGCTAATTISITLDKCLRLGDLVWNDLNNNGIKDNGESGIAGVTVKLYRDTNNDGTPDGPALDTKVTSSTGNYLFVGLEPDNYLVAIIAPAGYVSSIGKNGNTTGPYEGIDTPDPDDDINDDDNGSTVGLEIITKPVTLINFSEPTNDGDSDNNSNLTVDFGLFKPSKIGDYVWYDIDRDGIQNGTLTGVSGVKVTLTDALGNVLATTTTSSTGYYLFDNLGLGDYKVVFDKTTLPPAYVFSPQNAGGDSTKDSDVDTDGKTGVISITVPGTINLTIDAGINCPAPNIAISADKNSYCAGSQIQLSTVVTGSPTVASYSWVGPAGFTSSVQNPVIASASTTQGGVYTLTVTANNACAATATATVNVVVYAQPTVAATVVTSQVCKGGIIELKGNGSGNSYGWSGPAGFNSTQQNPTITNVDEINEGVYTLTVKDGNICSASATVNVIVNPLPTVTATGGVVCAGLSTNLNAQGATSYAWSGPNGFTATGASPSVNIQGIYTVVGTNTNGCTATATASLTVNPAATITASNIEVCVGGVAKLVATGGSNYAWSGPNGFSSTIAEPIVANSASTSLNGVYTVVATTSLGCIGSATATLTVKENPVVTILGNTVICPAGQVTLSTNATGIYSWSGPNSFTATTSSVNVSNPGTYQVSVTNNGCSAVGTIALTTETFSLAAFASPNITCTGGTINLRVNATVGSGIKSYAWSGPAGFTSTQATPTLNNVVVASSGVYTVSVEGNSGCASTATVNVTVQPIPTVNNTVGFCQGSKAVLSVNNYTSYLWNTGSTASSIEVTNSGIYTVTVTDINGCISFGSFNVTENPKPTATITGATAFCSYTSTDLTINSGVSGQTYSWTGPNGFSSTSQTITATEAGNYVVKVISDKGCEATTSVSVTKNTTTATATGGSTCEEGSITLTATGGTSYSWTGPNGFTSTAQNPQLTHLPKAGQGVYEVTVNNNGCTATATSSVTVYEKPVFVPVLANSTCNNNTPANNGYIKIIGFDTTNKYDIVEGSTYTGGKTFANATVIPSNGMLLSNIINPTTNKTYTIRVFNTNNCFTDKTVTIQAVTCECGPLICIPITIQRIGR